MTLQQLQYVVALDTYRHFVKAAESCLVAQPTLTLQVKKLEDEISLVIFDRSKQPLQPTKLGEQFILKARQILREVEALKVMVNDARDMLNGKFRIGIIPTLAPYLLPLFLKEFSDQHPDLQLEIKELQSEEIIRGLENDTIDAGLMVTPADTPFIREIVLFYEPFLVFANARHSILAQESLPPDNLDRSGLWLLNQGHCFRNQVLNICAQQQGQQSERFSFESGSIETLKNMILSHSGYTLVPELAVKMDFEKQNVRRFDAPEPAREVSLVVHNSFVKEQLLTNLRKVIVANLPEHFQKNRRFVTVKWR